MMKRVKGDLKYLQAHRSVATAARFRERPLHILVTIPVWHAQAKNVAKNKT